MHRSLASAVIALVLLVSSTAAAETLLVDVGKPGDAPAFSFENDVKMGGSTEMGFEHAGKRYRVVLRAVERSAIERSQTGLETPKIIVTLYRGGVSPDRLMARVEAEYPAGDQKTSCGVHVEPGMKEGFWITLGVGIAQSPRDSCDRMMRITRQMQKK